MSMALPSHPLLLTLTSFKRLDTKTDSSLKQSETKCAFLLPPTETLDLLKTTRLSELMDVFKPRCLSGKYVLEGTQTGSGLSPPQLLGEFRGNRHAHAEGIKN